AGAILGLVAILLAILFGRRIAEPIGALVAGARALGRGETPRLQAAGPVEVAEVARAMEAAGQERRRAEAALRRSEEELADFFENAAIGLHWAGPDGVILRANRAELELLGYAREEYVGHHIREFHEDPQVMDDILARLARGETVQGFETRLRCQDGSIKHVQIDANVLWEDGRFVHTRSFTRDVTEWKRVEQERRDLLEREQAARAEAESANRAKDEFLATLSHELRTPLTAMLGWVRLMGSDRLSAEQTSRGLATVERNIRLLAQLIEDLLDVSRIVAGKLIVEKYPVGLVSVLQEVVDSMRRDAEAQGVRLELTLDSPWEVVFGDPVRLQQIVSNLVSNALKFTPAGGRIDVTLSRRGDRARVEVRDTGQGIDPALLPHIFDRFRQADGSGRGGKGGLGLGLAIVRHLVLLHAGTVTAASEGKGRGAIFTVELPVMAVSRAAAEPSDQGRRQPAASRPPLDGATVLVVEDHADSRELIRTILTSAGAEVRVAGSVDEALGILGAAEVDVLLSDLGMPGADGFDLIRHVRAAERGGRRRRIAAVALTAYASREDRRRALEAGFEAHIPKPIDPEHLVRVVAWARGGPAAPVTSSGAS
ncbi:MAG: response regulator, partial [Candidatus Rokubacteria bacterium]|nr:response regulator [Candidatus Rokubacteria bacterium]